MSAYSVLLAATLLGAATSMLAAEPTLLRSAAATSGQTLSLPQTAAPPPATLEGELLVLAQQAGIIFSGEVLRVTPQPSEAPGVGVVEIVFRVDQAILGCAGQSTYTLREWAGLWTGGRRRYLPGLQLLVFLHAPSAAGLSSPVGGQIGVIPISGEAPAPHPEDTFLAEAEPTVDLRWIETRLLRSATAGETQQPSFALPSSPVYVGRRRVPVAARAATLPTPIAVNAPYATNAIESPARLPLSSGITLRGILAILGAWEAAHANAAH